MATRPSDNPMRIRLSEERRGDLLGSFGKFDRGEFDEELSDYRAQKILTFLSGRSDHPSTTKPSATHARSCSKSWKTWMPSSMNRTSNPEELDAAMEITLTPDEIIERSFEDYFWVPADVTVIDRPEIIYYSYPRDLGLWDRRA